MKKIRLVVYILLLAAIVAGCSSKPTEGNNAVVLKEVHLKDFEESLLTKLADDSFVFDIEDNSKGKANLSISIELYKDGKLAYPLLESRMKMTEKGKINRLMIAKQTFGDGHIKQKWIIANITDDSVSSSDGLEDRVNGPTPFSHAATYADLPLEIKKGEKKTIAAMVSTSQNGIATRDLEAVLNNPKATSKFTRAYLVRIEAK